METRRLVFYKATDKEHEKQLARLWKLMMPDEELESRITKQWQKIGFQVLFYLNG